MYSPAKRCVIGLHAVQQSTIDKHHCEMLLSYDVTAVDVNVSTIGAQ